MPNSFLGFYISSQICAKHEVERILAHLSPKVFQTVTNTQKIRTASLIFPRLKKRMFNS